MMNTTQPGIIIQAGPGDIDLLRTISILTFRETFAGSNTAADMDEYISTKLSREKLLEELSEPLSAFYFVSDAVSGTIKGYLKVNTGKAQTEPVGNRCLEIERIYILHAYQGSGTGRQLMRKALDIALDEKRDFVWLGVWEHNEQAIRFYQKQGFVAFDTHSFVLGEDEQTDILMKKILHRKV